MNARIVQRQQWAQRIQSAWRKSLESVLDCGRLLVEAKATLARGEFLAMIKADLPFQRQTAFRLMAVASDKRLSNVAHGQHLPTSWRTLYELTKLDDTSFLRLLSAGAIRPDMERGDVAGFLKKTQRAAREREAAERILALPDQRYGVMAAPLRPLRGPPARWRRARVGAVPDGVKKAGCWKTRLLLSRRSPILALTSILPPRRWVSEKGR
jgi:hypothetical protein